MCIEEIKDPVQTVIVSWVHRKRQRAQKNGEGIKKAKKLHTKERRSTHNDQ